MTDVSGIPNYSPVNVPTPWLNPQAPPTFTPTYTPQDLSNQNQNVVNNLFGPGGFGAQTNYYSGLGAAFGRATGGFGKMPDGSNAAPGRVGTINEGQQGPTTRGWESGVGLFNADAYKQLNPDVAASGMDPTAHWFEFGQKEGRDTGTFNAEKYWAQNPDVWAAGADPWQHYNQFGKQEGRDGAWDIFNPEAYKYYNPDVAEAGVDPTAHWFEFGQKEGRQGGGFNDTDYYVANPDVAASGMDAAEHWAAFGKKEGRAGGFDDAFNNYDMSSRNRNVPARLEASTGSDDLDPVLATQRKPFSDKLAADPVMRRNLANIIYRELKSDSPGREGLTEAALNRYYARGLDPLDPKYYPKHKADYNAQAARELDANPALLAQVYRDMDRALAGSNRSYYATDWGSLGVAERARSTATQTWTSPHQEEFFRRDFDKPGPGRTGAEAARQIRQWFESVTSPPR